MNNVVWLAGLLVLLLSSISNAEPANQAVPAQTPQPQPCTAAENEHFSFWLGKWISFDKDGNRQGTNHIHRVMGKCALQENWRSQGFEGTSYNFYSRSTGQWHQTWVDNSGGNLLLKGGLVGDSMQMSGERLNQNGDSVTDRITWTPLEDGRVRQHWQSTSDGGETWNDVFDGYYQKEK